MADKKPNPSDLYIQDFLRGMQTGQIGSKLPEDSLATTQLESDQIRNLAQDQVTLGQRDLGDYLQDVGTGLMGTFGAIGNTALLAGGALLDANEYVTEGSSDWQLTKGVLEHMNSTSQYWNSLQSVKSDAFDRITQYRQERAIEQANAEALAETGEDASWLRSQGAAFSAAAGSYLSNPDQIVTDGIAQLPYMLTGGVAKAATAAVPRAGALLARMVGKGMSVEAAEKAIQMGIVGGLQGTIEGADAASSAYDRVMRSTDTFGPEEQAARESAALEAAAKAFGIAGITSAVTGTLASKFELQPFKAMGNNAMARSGDNLIKALLEGAQETIESGTSQFAANYGGNTVLRGKDRVALDEGVGGAAGQGLVVGAGSTVITNPRSGVDAAIAPLVLAGKPFSYMADRAAKAERKEDMAAADANASDIIANITTPAAVAAVDAKLAEATNLNASVDIAPENVVLPPEMLPRTTDSPIGQAIRTFAIGMEYLRGKDMNSTDAVDSFHVLGAVLANANNIRSLRDGVARDAVDTNLAPEDQEKAKKTLVQLDGMLDNNLLDKWVADYPMEDIEGDLESLRQNPEDFGRVIAHLAERNPLRMTPKLIETALEAKSLPKPQRDALLLAQELKAAADDLKVTGKPDSAEVKRSMMQTGFPGYRENDSVAGYVSRVTAALAENDRATAQTEFHRLVKFANFEQGRAAAYEAAKDQMAKDPDSKRIELNGYYQLNEYRKLDKTKPQFVDKKALGLVKTVRSDADAIQKMVTLLAKRTGLAPVEAASTEAPVAVSKPAPTKTVTESKPRVEKPAAEPQAAPAAPTHVVLPKTSRYAAKDQAKSDRANKFIGRGAPGSSTAAYAEAWGDRANVGEYSSEDTVFISVNGNRPGALSPPWAEIKKAISAGATLITDVPTDRNRSFNTGERAVAAFLDDNGYFEESPGTWVRERVSGQHGQDIISEIEERAYAAAEKAAKAKYGDGVDVMRVFANDDELNTVYEKAIADADAELGGAYTREKNAREQEVSGAAAANKVKQKEAYAARAQAEREAERRGHRSNSKDAQEYQRINDKVVREAYEMTKGQLRDAIRRTRYRYEHTAPAPAHAAVDPRSFIAMDLDAMERIYNERFVEGVAKNDELTAEPKSEKPAAVEKDTELSAMSDEAIGQEMEQLAKAISRRRNNDTGKAVEQDVRYNALVYETARRLQQGSTKPTTPKAVDKPVEQPAPAKAEPVAAPVNNDESRITPEQAARLSPEGLQARIDAITQKGIQNTTKQDDSTLAVLNAEQARRDALPKVTAEAARATQESTEDNSESDRGGITLDDLATESAVSMAKHNPELTKEVNAFYEAITESNRKSLVAKLFVKLKNTMLRKKLPDGLTVFEGLTSRLMHVDEGSNTFYYKNKNGEDIVGNFTYNPALKAIQSFIIRSVNNKSNSASVKEVMEIMRGLLKEFSETVELQADRVSGSRTGNREYLRFQRVGNRFKLVDRAPSGWSGDDRGMPEAWSIPLPATEAVAEVVNEPSKNHYTDLMPSYPVAEGATVAEQNDAKNHLSQSFTTSDRPGLVSKLPKTADQMIESLGVSEQAADLIKGVFDLKNKLVGRLNEGIAALYPKNMLDAMLKGQNEWKKESSHSLYATRWDAESISFDPVIAEVMAWTAIQHSLDLVQPVKWSSEKEAQFVETYGEEILPLLAEGWVPLSEQVHQTARKLQNNLELTPNSDGNSMSQEYTEGTMLALAMDSLSTIMGKGRLLDSQQIATNAGPLVQWVRLQAHEDTWHDMARALENFFPERSSAIAGIVAKKPTEVNMLYRGSRQKVGKEQRKALLKMSQTSHKLSPLVLSLWKSLPEDVVERLFGYKPVDKKPTTIAEKARDGANRTLKSDIKAIKAHIRAVMEHAAANGVEITDVESFFEYEMAVNGRAMTKGTSPQSSKLYREIFSTVQREIDPTKGNRKFLLAVAQGFGIKMDKQNLGKSLDDLYVLWGKPEVRAAIDAMGRLVHNDLLQMEADITAIEQSGIELTPHAITALAHLAEFEKGEKFTSSLSYEIDGLTDGPINLMMLMGLRGSAEQMEHWLGLGGLWFSETAVVVQDKISQLEEWFTEKNGDKAKDLYEIIANKSSQINNEQARKILASVKPNQRDSAQGLMRAILHLMHITKLAESDLHALTAKHKRSFTKKPTQAAGYQQGMKSIINDLIDTMLESLSERIDAVDENGKPVMTDMDWSAVNALFGRRLGYSEEDKQYYVSAKPIKEGWAGEPLTKAERKALRNTLFSYGGIGLADATMTTIGFQRNHMEAAVSLVNARIQYAQATLRRLYKEKQDAEVAAGRLHPNQALSRKDENALIKQVWALVPHPMLRNTGGLPSASMSRNGVPLNDVRRVQGSLFNRQNLQVSEAGFEDPSVAFAALSIMASGDGSMMVGFFANYIFNALNMFDGIYIDPEDMDEVGDAINGEVKKNWEHDFIGAVLESVDMQDAEFRAWAEAYEQSGEGKPTLDELESAVKMLETQRQQQIRITKEINSRTHFVSHMAGHNGPHKHEGKPLNSTTLGTSTTDPLLDLAADELGTVTNGIRKLSATEIKKLLQDHTFENPVLSGLWKVLAPLLNDDLTLYMSSDKQGMAEFYQQNELQEMGTQTNGVSVGNRVYVRTINAETIVHELLHATTKNLTATYFSKPEALTAKQREAMKNLLTLQDQFMAIDPSTLSPLQQAMVEHTQSIMRNLDPNSALQEFLAYGLSNYHLQRTLGNTKSVLGSLVESVFNAIKALFGFPNGTQSDSMLAQMFSNFEALTEQATNVAYPISVENALESVNLDLARSFGSVLNRLVYADALQAVTGETQGQAGTATTQLAARNKARTRLASIKDLARTRMQELADTNLFPTMTDEQQAAGEYLQALFAASLQLKATDNALLVRVVDAVRDAGPKAWRTNGDPLDQTDIDLAQARYDFFFRKATSDHDQAADILAMSQVNPEFAAYLNKIILPQQNIQKGSLNNWLDSSAKFLYDKMDTGLALPKGATLDDALDVATLRIQKSLQASAKRNEAKSNAYRNFTNKLSQGVQYIGEMAGKTAEARLKLKSNKDWITSGLMILAGGTNDSYADLLGNLTLSLTNHLSAKNPVADLIQEMVGTTSDNYRLIQLKGLAARMVSAIRQTFREQVPVTVKSWFKDLSPEQDELLHTVIGKAAVYSLSKDLKNRMEELLTDPTNAKLDAERLLLNGGDRTKRLLMIKYAKHLGDRMANRGNQALYLNTRAIAGLAIHGGGEKLSTAEYAALENLSTLQALSHLTPLQRRQMLNLYRENTEGFWKTAALINAFHDFDTQRAGSNTATLNFQKGYIPVESDSRKKVKLFRKSEVRKAERMGWVQVGEFADDPNMVYMATAVGKTPTLSGGAIHAVDMHMNGIHFHTGMPTDPSIQTVISHPKAVAEIRTRILNGENMPYTVLYDAAGDVEGFQRVLDPAVVERHTKTVGRISDAAGIWLGRLHEERVAHGQNQAAADLLRKTWDQGKADKREHEFVNIRQTIDLKDPNAKQDKVIQNVWETMPYHTKIQLETAFADGSRNPPIWVRRDQLHDAIGYHKASVGNFFTGDNRYNSATNTNVAALARQFLGKNAYKYLVMGEEGWQAVVGAAKDTIIVKSLVVALNNLGSNQIQLFMITGNPVWNLRVQSQKHKELVSYLGYQQRDARLTAELLATSDPKALAKIAAEQKFLQGEMRKLSIWPLIDSGELPTIAEGLSETEEFSMVGDLTDWIEKQVGKLPPTAMTVLNNLVVSKETSLYKGLDRMVQYGDFVAKATMYEWLTTKDANAKKEALALMAKDSSKKLTYTDALHTAALMEINDEFVNYTRLPGRWRTYGEDMGLMWFYNYKLRILKIAFRRIRKNPAAFLIGAGVGNALGLATLMDSLPWNTNFSYSIGVDPLLSAHETIIWNQML